MEVINERSGKLIFTKVLLFFYFFSLMPSISNIGADLKLRVITKRANVRIKPSLKSAVLIQVPFGAILEAQEKKGNWFKVNLPPDESGFVILGFIHKSTIEVVGELEKTKSKRDKEEEIGKESSRKKAEKKVIFKSGEKKKKKFPWLIVVGGAVVVGVVLYLLLKKNKSNGDIDPDYDTTVLGIQWIQIPSGEFKMGDNFNEGYQDERPVHAVYLDSYSISIYEVTFDQYDKFCEESSRPEPDDEGWGREDRPVINVSWYDAQAFCEWLSEKTGKNIHLPTEAQWEKAARGTDQRRYSWGNSAPSCNIVNYNDCKGKTMPVGSYPSGVSPYGAHDMTGNVLEWCQDWYDPNYYSNSPYSNPTGPTSSYNSCRVRRGGHWGCGPFAVRTTYRYLRAQPSDISWGGGFRLVMDN